MSNTRFIDIQGTPAEQEGSNMHIIQEWREPDGHHLVIVRGARQEHAVASQPCFEVLWLQDLSGDIGKVKEVGSFPTLAEARAAVRARLATLHGTATAL